MSDTYDSIDERIWWHPEDVLLVHDNEFNIIAYGVPVEESEPAAKPAEVFAEPEPEVEVLPKPKHHSPDPGRTCVACDWDSLKLKIARHKAQQEASRGA